MIDTSKQTRFMFLASNDWKEPEYVVCLVSRIYFSIYSSKRVDEPSSTSSSFDSSLQIKFN